MRTHGRRGMKMKEFLDILKAIGLVFGVPFLAFFLLILPFISHIFTFCPSAIEGGKEEIGAKVYINGQYVGAMKKHKEYEPDIVVSRLCTTYKKGDLVRVEKEGYQAYIASLDPGGNESNAPFFIDEIKLTPLDEGKRSSSH